MSGRATLCWIALTTSALAQTHSSEGNLEDLAAALDQTLVTGASKRAELSSSAPATTTVITADDLYRYGIRSLDEAINFLSLGMVTQNPLHSVDVGARGVLLTSDFGNHVLVLLNGHILNEPWNGTAYFERGLGLPLELVDRVEVILGPGSVLYGSNAMLGVINIVTRTARESSRAFVSVEGDFSPAVDASANLRSPGTAEYWGDSGRGLRVTAGGANELTLFGRRAEFVGAIEYYGQKGNAFTFGPQPYGLDSVTGEPKRFSPTGEPTGIWGGVARRSFSTAVPSGHLRFSLGDFQLELKASSYRRSTPYLNNFNVFVGDFDTPSDELDQLITFDARQGLQLGTNSRLSFRLYVDLYHYTQTVQTSAAEDCSEGQLDGCTRIANGASRWSGLETVLTHDWLGDGRYLLTAGLDVRLRWTGGDNYNLSPGESSAPPYLLYSSLHGLGALYLQQEARPWRWLALNVGARGDYDPRFGFKLSPRAAATAELWTGANAKVVYAEAFRAATSYELEYVDPLQQAAPGSLRPESVRSIEASVEQRVGGHRFMFGAFRSWWRDMVLLQELSAEELEIAIASGQLVPTAMTGFRYGNVSGIDNYGLNAVLEGAFLLSRLRYALQLTLARTLRNFDDGAEPVPLTVAPQLFGNARVSYSFGEGKPTVALAAAFVGPRLADRALDGGFVPEPTAPPQLDLRATVTTRLPLKGLSLRALASYSFASRSAYVAGPLQAATPDFPNAELAPVDRLSLGLALRYDLQ